MLVRVALANRTARIVEALPAQAAFTSLRSQRRKPPLIARTSEHKKGKDQFGGLP